MISIAQICRGTATMPPDPPETGHAESDPAARADAQQRVAGWIGR
jgi:hypothetical protein